MSWWVVGTLGGRRDRPFRWRQQAFKGSFAGQRASPGERGQPCHWSLVGSQTVAEFSLGSVRPWHNRHAHASCVCKASDSLEGWQHTWLQE